MWILVLFFLQIYSFAEQHQTYFCVPKNVTDVYLKPNEITFIETFNFPNVKDKLDMKPLGCNVTFYIEPSSINKSIIIFVTNPLSLDSSIINGKNNASWYNRGDYQGFAIHNEMNQNECFLESISKPYKFENVSQILYIRSSILKLNERKNPCNWHFTASNGYGFKIVITELMLTFDVTLVVTNSSDFIIVNHRSAILNKAYYNEDQNLFIFLSNSNQSFLLRYEFGAYISIVKKSYKIVDAKCTIESLNDDENSTSLLSWTNINYLNPNGFENNAYCSYEFLILPNTLIIAKRIPDYTLETADVVTYYDEISDTFERFDFNKKYVDGKIFFPNKNNTPRNMVWEFKSDGSVRSGGFKIYFYKVYCYCASAIWLVSCDGDLSSYQLTNSSILADDIYCSNMRCNYTIQFDTLCPNKLIKMEIVVSQLSSKLKDYFRLTSNNKTVFFIDSSNYNLFQFDLVLNPNAINIFEAFTFDTELLIPRSLGVDLSAVEEPKLKKTIFLTVQKPYYFLDAHLLSDLDIFSIQIQNISVSLQLSTYLKIIIRKFKELEKTFIEVHITTVYPIPLYTDETLTKQIQNKLIGHCLFDTNVFMIGDYLPNPIIPLSAIATSNGTCNVYLLTIVEIYSYLDNPYNIQKVWTTAAKNNVKVFTGTENKVLLFEFNHETSDEWQRIALNSPFYIFEIPANSSLFISTNKTEPIVQNEPYKYCTIIQTPYYLYVQDLYNFNMNCFSNFTIDENVYVNFNVTYFNVSPFMSFQFFIDNDLQNVNKVGTKITLTNVSILLCYIKFNETIDGNLIAKDPGVIIQMDIRTSNDLLTTESSSNISPTTETTTITTSVIPYSSTINDANNFKKDNYNMFLFLCFLFYICLCC